MSAKYSGIKITIGGVDMTDQIADWPTFTSRERGRAVLGKSESETVPLEQTACYEMSCETTLYGSDAQRINNFLALLTDRRGTSNASDDTLAKRAFYRGRKGRAAMRRLKAKGLSAVQFVASTTDMGDRDLGTMAMRVTPTLHGFHLAP